MPFSSRARSRLVVDPAAPPAPPAPDWFGAVLVPLPGAPGRTRPRADRPHRASVAAVLRDGPLAAAPADGGEIA